MGTILRQGATQGEGDPLVHRHRVTLYGPSRAGVYASGGARVSVEEGTGGGKPRGGGGTRGVVSEYTRHSRRRLRETVWDVTPHLVSQRTPAGVVTPGTFVTLTYPAVFELDAHECKGHLKTWWKRLVRAHSGAWAIWCIERQARGAWHFHLIVRWPAPPVRAAGGWAGRLRWVSRTWAEVVAGDGVPDPDHLRAGTRCDRLVTVASLGKYVSKPGSKAATSSPARELSKRVQKGAGQGRWWGVLGRQAYSEAAHRVDVLVSNTNAAALLDELRRDWRAWYAQHGLESERLPAWADGRVLARAASRAGIDLFTSVAWVDSDGVVDDPADATAAVV